MRTPITVLVAVCLALSGLAAAAPAQTNAGAIVLDTSGYWRNYFVLAPPVVRDGAELKRLKTLAGETPLPPKDWTAPEFDDSLWARTPGRPLPVANFLHVHYGKTIDPAALDAGFATSENSSPALALECLRGKFQVADPAAAGNLTLALRYRGGMVVYVNGKEVARLSLSKETVGRETLAEDYPREAFFRPDGSLCRGAERNDPNRDLAAWKLRVRTAEVPIPSGLLRRGANVVALEVHRCAYPADVQKAVSKTSVYEAADNLWVTCGLLQARLTADSSAGSGAGVVSNMLRPKGLHVWNSQIMQPDFDLDFGDPGEPLRPVRIVGARGGMFSGKVAVGSGVPIRGLRAAMGRLTAAAGGASIPEAAVKVRYALPTGWEPIVSSRYPLPATLLDGLAEMPPAEVAVRDGGGRNDPEMALPGQPAWPAGAVCPVWVTVAVPEDAEAGEYKGELSILAQGEKPVAVPVILTVCPWRVPRPSEFRTLVDIIESPESVALQYGVPLYGDRHFALLEKSFERAGYVGSWTVHIPLICQSNLGNEQTMVRWVKKKVSGARVQGSGGTGGASSPDPRTLNPEPFTFDFSVMDRYLDLAEKHMGKPRIVVLVVWDFFLGTAGSGHASIGASIVKPEDIPVSVLDEATGGIAMETVGRYDEKSKAQWLALVTELRAHLRARGLDQAAALGTANDFEPTPEIFDYWKQLWPEASWARYGHVEKKTVGKSQTPWALQSIVACHGSLGDVTKGRSTSYGWQRPDRTAMFFRINYVRRTIPYLSVPWDVSRLLGEISTQCPLRGFARFGLDFWPVLADKKGEKVHSIQARYPKSQWLQLDAMIKCFVPPGPDGAMATGKLEMMREGLQEQEARILLESALTTPSLRSKLSPALAARCQQVLDDRIAALTMTLEEQQQAGFSLYRGWWDGFGTGDFDGAHAAIFRQWYMESGWQERSADLFNAAADVAKALK